MNDEELLRALQGLPDRRPPDPARLLASFDALPRLRERGAPLFVGALLAGAALALVARPADSARVLDEGVLLRAQQVAHTCIERLEERL